ncbi:hypothetical protein BE11_02710 [Sorangium cellulosum]|nr:hypothetical protein BE11_02710 [Sorangium cellulosum]
MSRRQRRSSYENVGSGFGVRGPSARGFARRRGFVAFRVASAVAVAEGEVGSACAVALAP